MERAIKNRRVMILAPDIFSKKDKSIHFFRILYLPLELFLWVQGLIRPFIIN
jgi:hypothetical protein